MSEQKTSRPNQALATEAWIAVVRAYNDCTALLSLRLEPMGVSLLQHEIMMNLLRTPGITQQQVSDRCYSAKSGVSMIVSRLEKSGMLKRVRSETDKRAWCLHLTTAGEELAGRTEHEQARMVAQMASVYSQNEILLLKDRMQETSEALRALKHAQ